MREREREIERERERWRDRDAREKKGFASEHTPTLLTATASKTDMQRERGVFGKSF